MNNVDTLDVSEHVTGERVLEALQANNINTDLRFNVPCEFKTATTDKTIQEATNRLDKLRDHCGNNIASSFVVFVGFQGTNEKDGLSLLYKLAPEASHRTQLAHHCAVTGSSSVLYVMARQKKIIYTALVFLHPTIIREYRKLMAHV